MQRRKSIEDLLRKVDFDYHMLVNCEAMDLRKHRAQSILPETI